MAKASGARAVAIYTLLRVGLFLLVWLTIELLTPLAGIWAIVLAIVLSGLISLFLLDRPRNKAGVAAGGFFRGINERIEASARAEDVDDDEPAVAPPTTDGDTGQASASNPPSTNP